MASRHCCFGGTIHINVKNIRKFSMNGRNFLNFRRITFLHIAKYSHVAKKQTPAEYCFDLVRKYDYENFLCTLSLIPQVRSAVFAIRALNVEVARVQDHIHDHKIGEMRLKFWSNALNSTFKGNPPRSPVLLELARILENHSLSIHYFQRLIDIRLEHLKNPMFLDLRAIEKYTEYSTSSIYYLILEAHSIHSVKAVHAASHMGKAHGIINIIRSIPYNAKNRVNMMPQDILMKHGVSTEAIFQGEVSQNLKNAIYDITSFGTKHLSMATSFSRDLDSDYTQHIFLPKVCLYSYIKKLSKADYNIFDTKLHRRNYLLALDLFVQKWFTVSK
ncbi:NADH dehydrogenase (ubiquinone) complex I, assembly factor 6 homolog sicily [Halictus rubicundus]|uniref:NADH dehydrogenase (ubiquinone) complex I, assembly factor 6 homolog sicily n=1 Tax=Halictus rubicundus TaxID=77578 RepID=UPI0040371FF5